MALIIATCTSEKKGTQKIDVGSINLITDFGIEGDAHAGKWHRQVSLLGYDEIEIFKQQGIDISHGDFGENIIVKGIDFDEFIIGTILTCNDTILEITQIGKECHSRCKIYDKMGDCIMPKKGIFTKVLHGGKISVGDNIYIKEAE